MNGLLLKQDLRQVMSLVNEILKSLLDLKERSLYDALSMGFVKLNLFPTLIKSVIAVPLEE